MTKEEMKRIQAIGQVAAEDIDRIAKEAGEEMGTTELEKDFYAYSIIRTVFKAMEESI